MPDTLFRRMGIVLLASALVGVCPQTQAQEPARLGINLSSVVDWGTELPFVDVFRSSRTWISQVESGPWGSGPALDLDERGWVRSLPGDGVYAEALMLTQPRYPRGDYHVFYEGRGQITFRGATVVSSEPGHMVVRVGGGSGIGLELRQTDPADPVRDIRVVMPSHQDTYAQEPFHPLFLKRWQGFAAFRYMDWMKTNTSSITTWQSRPTMELATWSRKGIPIEVMVDLSNRTGVDPWFNIPHAADDDYVRRFAQTVRDRLDPSRQVILEYSNEVWNSQFPQHAYAVERGRDLGLTGGLTQPSSADYAAHYTARRSREIFAIFEEVFGGRDRLVRVLPSQSVNTYISRRLAAFENAYQHADVLAIAPYFGFNIKPQDAQHWIDAGVDAILDHIAQVTLPKAISDIRAQKQLADEFGLRLFAYESGQHLVGHLGAENNAELTALLHEANRHPRMGELYTRYYDAWREAGGELMIAFASTSQWTKWGSWGLMEFYDDDPMASPKMKATLEWARANGQPVSFIPEPASAALLSASLLLVRARPDSTPARSDVPGSR